MGIKSPRWLKRTAFLSPWLAIWPGVAISLAVLGINMFGDALRDVLDPQA